MPSLRSIYDYKICIVIVSDESFVAPSKWSQAENAILLYNESDASIEQMIVDLWVKKNPNG